MFGLTLLTLLSGCAEKGCCYVECVVDDHWVTENLTEGSCEESATNACWDAAGQDPIRITWVAGCADCDASCAPDGWEG